jgi:glycosyltransferase involved in cell wall biosynthesis/CelD/BcsL family acetyltransferase involved in cellulose biosynthesis
VTGGRRHVLFLTDVFGGPHGGTEGQLTALIENLPAGWRASLWVLDDSVYLGRGPFPCPWRILRMPPWRSPAFLPRLRALALRVRRARVDLVHAFHADTCTVAPLLGRLAGVPAITSRRDLGYWQTPRGVAALRRANRLATRIVANSREVARRTIEVEEVPPSLVRVIHNGHAPLRFEAPADPGLRAGLGIPDDAPLVGMVANFRPLKRPQDLVAAMARLLERHPRLHALFVGHDEPWPDLARRMERSDVAGRVHRLAVAGDVVPVLKHLDVGVLCSQTEGLSNALLEYLGAGLPVVATQVGGNAEVIEPGRNGLLVPVGDVPALAEAIDGLLRDGERRRRMGAEGRRVLAERFSLDRMVSETVALWEECLAPRRTSPALRFEVVTEERDLEPLEGAWESLLGPKHFFLSPAWVRTWIRSFGAEPRSVVAREAGGDVVGLLPAVRLARGIGFAGQEHGADHLDVLARPGRELEVARGALSALRDLRQGALRLRHLREESALRVAAREMRLPFGERRSTVCPYVRSDAGFEGWLQERLDRKRRHELRRLLRRFEETESARMRMAATAEEARDLLERLFALHARRFASQGRDTAFSGERVAAFHRDLIDALWEKGQVRLAALEARPGEIAALFHGFVFRGAFHHFQSGVDEGLGVTSPGTVLRGLLLRDGVFGAGLSEFDFLDGDEAYKFQWATGVRPLFDLTVPSAGSAGRVGALVTGAAALARDLLRAPTAGAR